MDLRAVEAVISDQGQALLASLPPSYDPGAALQVATRLRSAGHAADLVSTVLTQCELRHRAKAKFGDDASTLLFTRDGLEQSSRADVAAVHAARLTACGIGHVYDLGCGIGGDAIAFARAGIGVDAVELDPVTAAIAEHNLSRYVGAPGPRPARVHLGRAQDPQWARAAHLGAPSPGRARTAAWLDPARRTPGVADATGRTRRTRSVEQMSPSWEQVLEIAATWPAVGAKFGAGLPHDRIPAQAHAQWVSHRNQALECVLWWGDLATHPGTAGALVHYDGSWHELNGDHVLSADPTRAVRSTEDVGAYIYDVDPAVVAAGLRPQLAAYLDADLLGSVGYLSAASSAELPWARAWVVREVLPLQVAALRAWVRREDIGPLTVKRPSRRALPANTLPDPDALRRAVAPRGSIEATLLFTDLAPGRPGMALWVSPVQRSPSGADLLNGLGGVDGHVEC